MAKPFNNCLKEIEEEIKRYDRKVHRSGSKNTPNKVSVPVFSVKTADDLMRDAERRMMQLNRASGKSKTRKIATPLTATKQSSSRVSGKRTDDIMKDAQRKIEQLDRALGKRTSPHPVAHKIDVQLSAVKTAKPFAMLVDEFEKEVKRLDKLEMMKKSKETRKIATPLTATKQPASRETRKTATPLTATKQSSSRETRKIATPLTATKQPALRETRKTATPLTATKQYSLKAQAQSAKKTEPPPFFTPKCKKSLFDVATVTPKMKKGIYEYNAMRNDYYKYLKTPKASRKELEDCDDSLSSKVQRQLLSLN